MILACALAGYASRSRHDRDDRRRGPVAAYNRDKSDRILITRTVDHQVAHCICLTDPDGHSREFYCDTLKN